MRLDKYGIYCEIPINKSTRFADIHKYIKGQARKGFVELFIHGEYYCRLYPNSIALNEMYFVIGNDLDAIVPKLIQLTSIVSISPLILCHIKNSGYSINKYFATKKL